MRAGQREAGRCVVERRSLPLRRGVAERAVLREPGRTWFGFVVAWKSPGGSPHTAVFVVPCSTAIDVALAHATVVCAPVSGNSVFEWSNLAPSPLRGRVASRAVLRESGRTWFGFVVALEILQVAADALRRVPVYWPLTWQLAQAAVVCAPVSGNAVVEWSNFAPVHCAVVWHSAQSCGKPAARGSGSSSLEVLQVAADALRRCVSGVVAVDVALRTATVRVRTGQRETGLRVIELRARPLRGRVAERAVLRESGRHVVRILGALEILQVAADALRRRPGVLPVDVALAQATLVCAPVSGNRVFEWSKVAPCPLHRRVAQRAVLREAGRHVIRIRGALEVLQVAADALYAWSRCIVR